MPRQLWQHCLAETGTNEKLTTHAPQTDNVRGHKDYELHQHTLVKESFDSLLSLPDVRRCLVMGFSGQNPFTMTYDGQHPWSQAKERRIRRDAQKNQEKGASQRVDEVLMILKDHRRLGFERMHIAQKLISFGSKYAMVLTAQKDLDAPEFHKFAEEENNEMLSNGRYYVVVLAGKILASGDREREFVTLR
ncbi:hypothetical protein B0A49_12647 [Cryomyces minteri]|uniref:Uncharacterized protein n=1 Tax=Cryomyces minteri TaxID=331657 RepID=A0A4U0WFC3_9PEZI|nr:hypothetical protein B0A49_12647 [Cryomyces minteri]